MKRRGYGPELLRSLLGDFRSDPAQDEPSPVGLIAGWGSFPVEVAQRIVASGGRVCCIAINDHASTDLESICDHVKWSGVGKLGAHIRYFRRRGVQRVTMAGKLFKSDILFQGSVLLKHFPDWTAIRTWGPCLLGRRPDSRDDRLLTAVTEAYARKSLTIHPATELAPELLVDEGHLIGKPLTEKQRRDARFGWQIAKQMGGLDIGQSITIKDGTVLAVEAVEGTDRCIERTGELCRRGGWVLVKVSKPEQDMRFDVPTIGPQTIQQVSAAGGVAVIVEADKTILVEREQTLSLARQHGVTIVAMNPPIDLTAVA
ncbi:MAG: UDP-2,3-diacylglucosamine diphosphatase LpxI [Planctomycetota bacterium]